MWAYMQASVCVCVLVSNYEDDTISVSPLLVW